MKLGLFLPFATPVADAAFVRAAGTAAEEAGFDSIWVAEHVVLFDEYASKYPYSADGRIPARRHVRASSSRSTRSPSWRRARAGSGSAPASASCPQRNPVYTAKEAATVDWLSGGRLDLGVGVGWLAEEFQAVGVPFERRGERCRSYLEVMKRLWCDPVSEYKDEFYELPACRAYPKPVQQPHPPIHFGGESEAALRRVADVGQGWYGFNLGPEELADRLKRLDQLLAAKGRRRSDVQITVSPYLRSRTPDLEAYKRAGADQVILLAFAANADGARSAIAKLAEEFLPLARKLA